MSDLVKKFKDIFEDYKPPKPAKKTVRVKSYIKKDGTIVKEHWKKKAPYHRPPFPERF